MGRFSLDQRNELPRGTNVFPSSDGLEFISKLKENAKTKDEKCIVFGMELHYLQDRLVSKFFSDIFGTPYKTTYFDYCKLEKWCLVDRGSSKLFINSLYYEKNNNLNPFYDEVFKLYPNIDKNITLVCPMLIKQYYSRGNFFELRDYSDLLVRTYNSFPESKNLDKLVCPEFIKEAIDTLIGANAILFYIPNLEFSEDEKEKTLKAFENMQLYLLNLLDKLDWSFYE